MNLQDAKAIILNAVQKTEWRWRQYDEHWENIDEVFLRRGYEQGGFEAWKFTDLLKQGGILSIEKLGTILGHYKGEKRYNRQNAGSIDAPFYRDLLKGLYGHVGRQFYTSILNFKGRPGAWFWVKLWQMLVCCNFLRNHYKSSFGHSLKTKYQEFKKLSSITDDEFLNVSCDDWGEFKRKVKPWNELYGIGENVLDFIVADIVEARFAKDSYKLDSANIHFFKVTGIYKLIPTLQRESIVSFLKGLSLSYSIREINKGIYTYCSKTEAEKFGFCYEAVKCRYCGVFYICEKNFSFGERETEEVSDGG